MTDNQITLALHIGLHKTATTHLQRTLQENQPLLDENGIAYYGPRALRKTGYAPRQMFQIDGAVASRVVKGRTPVQQLEHLAKGHNRVVISEENFVGVLHPRNRPFPIPAYAKAASRIAELAAKIAPHKLQVYLCLRDPAPFLVSSYGQMLFGAGQIEFAQYRRRVEPQDISWLHLVRSISQIPGLRDFYIWRYEDYRQIEGLIWRRLLRWKMGPLIEPYSAPVHQGLSQHAVQAVLEWRANGDLSRSGLEARDLYPVSESNPKFQPFSPEELAASRTRYDGEIARIKEIEGVTFLQPRGD